MADCQETSFDEYGKLMIEIFKDKIINSISLSKSKSSIFHHMTEYVEKNSIEGLSPNDQCLDFLDKLRACTKPGWYRAFLFRLEKEGHEVILKALQLEEPGQASEFMNELIKIFLDELRTICDIRSIAVEMTSKEVIVPKDKQAILCENQNEGPQAAMLSLLEIMACKAENWGVHFVEILYVCKYLSILEKMDPDGDLIRAIEEGRTKEFIEAWAASQTTMADGSDRKKLKAMEEFDSRQVVKMDVSGEAGPSALNAGNLSPHNCSLSLSDGIGVRPTDIDGASQVGEVEISTASQGVAAFGMRPTDIDGASTVGNVVMSVEGPGDNIALLDAGNSIVAHPEDSDGDEFFDAEDDTNINSLCDKDTTYVKQVAFPNNIEESIVTNSRQPDVGNVQDITEEEIEQEAEPQPPKPIELRSYQKELMEPALEGKNTIIVAPTGSGKTLVAVKIIENHFKEGFANEALDPKVVFLVPTVALVKQQTSVIQQHLTVKRRDGKVVRAKGLSGDSQTSGKDPIKEIVDHFQVLVMTPALLDQTLIERDVESIQKFTLILLDECHHTVKNHPYNKIMGHYLDEKVKLGQRYSSLLPQVIGMTASVGVGQARKDKDAVEYILRLCSNLDAEKLQTVQKNTDELSRYENRPEKDMEEVQVRKEDPFYDKISGIMKRIEDRMPRDIPNLAQKLLAPPPVRGSDGYTQWLSALKKPVAEIVDQTTRRLFVACTRDLKIYNNSLLINADCRTKDALSYLSREFELVDQFSRGTFDATDEWLRSLFNKDEKTALEIHSENPRYHNPKLLRLQEIIMKAYRAESDMRAIVFCKTREMTEALVNWMKESEDMSDLNPKSITGTAVTTEKRGMTATQQQDALQYFKDGKHKVIIATSVAEEGLDIQKCNLVVRYIHVTNMVAHVQARGRARADEASYVTVGNADTVTRDLSNEMREQMQSRAIRMIQRMTDERFKYVIKEFQKESKIEREMAQTGKTVEEYHRASRRTNEDYELRCFKCDKFALFTSGLRTIKQTHRVVVDEDFEKKVVVKPHPKPARFDEWVQTGKLFCKKCNSDWGMKALYKKIPFAVLKIESFVVIGERGKRDIYNKWKKTPFVLEEMSIEDLQTRANQERGAIVQP